MDLVGIGISIFIIIIIIITLILYLVSLTALGTSRSGLIDDENSDPAYNRGSYAILAAIVALSLVASTIVLFYYQESSSIFLIVIVFISFVLLLISGGFGVSSCQSMSNVLEPDDNINKAISYMTYSYIASFAAALFTFILFIYTIFIYNYVDEPELEDIYYTYQPLPRAFPEIPEITTSNYIETVDIKPPDTLEVSNSV